MFKKNYSPDLNMHKNQVGSADSDLKARCISGKAEAGRPLGPSGLPEAGPHLEERPSTHCNEST